MLPEQEPKYRAVVHGQVDIFRARDKHAAAALIFYRDLCADANHKAVIQSRWEDFMRFWREHPERMKEPDS